MENNTLTCVYCGHEYPAGTPASGADVQALTTHIKACSKHPFGKVRKALANLVGADGKEELDGLELAVRSQSAPASDKAAMIDAIDALRDTL